MEILNLKDSVEKDTFFRKLPNLSEQLPREIVLKKVFITILGDKLHPTIVYSASPMDSCSIFWFLQLLPLLASSLEFGSAAAPALTALLKMGSWLSKEEFSAKVALLTSSANFCPSDLNQCICF